MARPRKARYAKPRPSFPLTPYKGGWCKKLGGRPRHVCGHVPPDEALSIWESRAVEFRTLYEKPEAAVPPVAGLAVRVVVGRWLQRMRTRMELGGVTAGHFSKCRRDGTLAIDALGGTTLAEGLGPDQMFLVRQAIDAGGGAVSHRRQRAMIAKSIFTFAYDENWIEQPPRFGKRYWEDLREKVTRRVGYDSGKRFSRSECRHLLVAIGRKLKKIERDKRLKPRHWSGYERGITSARQLRAMMWLALNGGYHASELAELEKSDVDFDKGRIETPRPKTGVDHRVPLWPETIAALRSVMAERPDDPLLFRTSHGKVWARDEVRMRPDGSIRAIHRCNAVAGAFTSLMKEAGMHRAGRGFHGLRHTHRSMSGNARDPNAEKVLIGHQVKGSEAVYEHVDWKRLERVASVVHDWLRSSADVA